MAKKKAAKNQGFTLEDRHIFMGVLIVAAVLGLVLAYMKGFTLGLQGADALMY